MADCSRVALILLAAGRSTRFGEANKLLHLLNGKPLMMHAMETLSALPFASHILVGGTDTCAIAPDLFRPVVNEAPERGMGHSIALGVKVIEASEVSACLITLADMPFIPPSHFKALVSEGSDNFTSACVGTAVHRRTQVPALFGRDHFGVLNRLKGDAGARDLLCLATKVAADPAWLADMDRLEDFAGY